MDTRVLVDTFRRPFSIGERSSILPVIHEIILLSVFSPNNANPTTALFISVLRRRRNGIRQTIVSRSRLTKITVAEKLSRFFSRVGASLEGQGMISSE